MLVAALLVPAILAAGLLMADLAGYGEWVSGAGSRGVAVGVEPVAGEARTRVASAGDVGRGRAPTGTPGTQPARSATTGAAGDPLLEPTPVPGPSGPLRRYEGLIRIIPPIMPPVRKVVVPRPAPAPVRSPEKPEPREEETFTCAPEWRDTWLWEVCREHEGQLDDAE